MSAKIYSVDEAIANYKPKIELRGELYPLRDLRLEDRLRALIDTQQRQEAAEKQDDSDVAVQEVIADAVQTALEGVPREVALDLTELEITVLTRALAKARNVELDPVGKEMPVGEKEKKEA